MAIKAELISAEKTPELLERILKLRNPELWAARKRKHAKAQAKACRHGRELKPYPPSWALIRAENSSSTHSSVSG